MRQYQPLYSPMLIFPVFLRTTTVPPAQAVIPVSNPHTCSTLQHAQVLTLMTNGQPHHPSHRSSHSGKNYVMLFQLNTLMYALLPPSRTSPPYDCMTPVDSLVLAVSTSHAPSTCLHAHGRHYDPHCCTALSPMIHCTSHHHTSSLLLPLSTIQPYLFHHLTPLAHYLDNVRGHNWSLKLFADHGSRVTSMPL